MANYRTAGLADMAIAIAEGRLHRCSMEAALHAVEIMTGILKSGETGKFVDHDHHLRAAGGARHRRGKGTARQETLPASRPDGDRRPRRAALGPFPAWRTHHGLASGRQSLRRDDLQSLRPFRAQAAGDLARPLAQFRRGHAAPDEARASAARRSTSASRISTSPTITARRRARPRRRSAKSSGPILPAIATRSIISSKAGYDMWPGPYGEWGSRKYLLASLDQSLKRWASTMSISSTRTASIPTRRSKKR